jgi:prepilin-type N-terminal cleavage/methylation domain-containing protein
LRRGRLTDNRGFTLVELMVAVAVLAVVLLGAYTALSNMQNASTGATERLVNLDEARLLMATITKDLRTAARPDPTESPFVFADGRRIQFYANLNTAQGPQLVTAYIDVEKRLVEETIPPTDPPPPGPPYTYNPANQVTRVVGEWVANTGPVFKFFQYNADLDVMEEITNGGMPLTSDQLKQVEAVEVTLSIRRTPAIGSPPTTLVNQVRLPNVDYNPLPSPAP